MKYKLSKIQSVSGGAIILTIFGLISKLLGFVREMIVAGLFGTTGALDAVFIASSAITVLVGIFMGGITNLFLPNYLRIKEKDKLNSRKYATDVTLAVSFISIGLGVLLYIFPTQIINVLAPGFDKELVFYAARKIRILSIMPFILGLSRIFATLLRAERRFFYYSVSQLAYNLIYIPILIFVSPRLSESAYILGMILGNFGIVVFYFIFSKDIFKKSFKPLSKDVRRTIKLALPIMLSTGIGSINQIIDKAFVSLLPEGRVSSLQFAHTLLGLVSFAIISFLTTSYTELSEHIAKDEKEKAVTRMKYTITTSINLVIPLTAWIAIMANPLISFVYQRGSFTEESTALVSSALIGYSLILISQPIAITSNQFISAVGKVKIFGLIALFSVGTNTFFDWLFLKPFGHAGIAFSTSIVSIINAVIVTFYLYKKGIDYIPYKRLMKVLFIGILLFLVGFLSKGKINDILWFVVINVCMFVFFLYSAKSDLKTIIKKILHFRKSFNKKGSQ